MIRKTATSLYQQVSTVSAIDSATPHRLIQMLLDGALGTIATAKGHLIRSETAKKGEQIGKAISIVEGLRTSLDPLAGELSQNLDDLYEYVGRRLLEVQVSDDVAVLDEVAGLLREVKSAWDVLADEESVATQVPTPSGS